MLNLKQREVKSGFGIAYVYGRNWVSQIIIKCNLCTFKQELRRITSHLALFSWFGLVLNFIFSNNNQLQLGDIRADLNKSDEFVASHRRETRMLPFSAGKLISLTNEQNFGLFKNWPS